MDKGIIVLSVSVVMSCCLLLDSILSWTLLADAPKPLNYWYLTFTILLLAQSSLCLCLRFCKNKIKNKCKRGYECFQFLGWLFIMAWLIPGYTWLITSWYYAEMTVPLRLKVEFLTLLVGFTCLFLPVLVISIYTLFRVILYLNGIRRKATMRLRLQDLHSKIYDSKFDFKEIENELSIEFYEFPLKRPEIELIQSEFSVVLSEDRQKSDGCSICYSEFKQGDTLTTVPMCGHDFHFECIELWLRSQTTCPCCRGVIRKNLVEHYHGCVKIRHEKSARQIHRPDVDIINEISLRVNNSKRAINTQLVEAAEKC
jgi:hypothetical protein